MLRDRHLGPGRLPTARKHLDLPGIEFLPVFDLVDAGILGGLRTSWLRWTTPLLSVGPRAVTPWSPSLARRARGSAGRRGVHDRAGLRFRHGEPERRRGVDQGGGRGRPRRRHPRRGGRDASYPLTQNAFRAMAAQVARGRAGAELGEAAVTRT